MGFRKGETHSQQQPDIQKGENNPSDVVFVLKHLQSATEKQNLSQCSESKSCIPAGKTKVKVEGDRTK